MLNRVLFISSAVCGLFIIVAETKVLEPGKDDFIPGIIINSTPTPIVADNHPILVSFDQGRGHLHKSKRFLKNLYPFLMLVLFAKLIVVPLILKLLIATTSSAFVMSKIALVTSALLVLSWLLGLTKDRTKLQIVQYPAGSTSKFDGGWNVNSKYTPYYASSYIDWPYDANFGENIEKISFL